MPRVVVTGLGLVTSLGSDVESSWKALCAGASGVGEITGYDTSQHKVHFGAEVKHFDPLPYMNRKEVHRSDPYEQFAIATSKQALAQACLEITDENADEIGVYIGSGIGLNEEGQEITFPRRCSLVSIQPVSTTASHPCSARSRTRSHHLSSYQAQNTA